MTGKGFVEMLECLEWLNSFLVDRDIDDWPVTAARSIGRQLTWLTYATTKPKHFQIQLSQRERDASSALVPWPLSSWWSGDSSLYSKADINLDAYLQSERVKNVLWSRISRVRLSGLELISDSQNSVAWQKRSKNRLIPCHPRLSLSIGTYNESCFFLATYSN